MKFEHIDASKFKTTQWAAGNTTELYIYPPDSDFTKRQFLWRLSKATVMSLSSTFTPLYSVVRWIMPLDGILTLKHKKEGKVLYRITLHPFQAHSFRGDWETESEGKVADFNLMLKEGARGDLSHVLLDGSQISLESLLDFEDFDAFPRVSIALYPVDGMIKVNELEIQAGELLFIHSKYSDKDEKKLSNVLLSTDQAVNLVVAKMIY